MNRTASIKNSLTLAFLILTVSFLISSNSVAEESESNPVPIHLNLKESAKLSPETSGDLERVAMEEKHSSHDSNPGAGTPASTRNKGDWKSMGTWESDGVNYDTTINNIMLINWCNWDINRR